MADSPYKMQLDLRVLEHLGIKLYSNAAAVLSEAVANSWDADAETVSITSSPDHFVIDDDGAGMNLEDVNDRFLNVGYDKRNKEGERSAKGRAFMGRKGIGKLSLFSIADDIEIYTTRGTERHAFRMRTEDIKKAIAAKGDYRPEPIPIDAAKGKGTKIVLRQLKKRRTAATTQALRKRIARRFSIIGYEGEGGDKFNVVLDGKSIGGDDREDFKTVEFLWEFGSEEKIPNKNLPLLKSRFVKPGVVREGVQWVVRGWIGAAARPKQLKHDEAGTMNGIVVLARGRLIQENILDKLSFNRIFSNYVMGQVDADFLDLAGEDDIATSDRQRLMEDDERYVALTIFLRETMLALSDQWTSLRNEARGKEAIEDVPVLGEWLEQLKPAQRRAASRLLGLIQGIELEDEEDRTQLYRSGIAAFERLRLREESHILGELQNLTAENLLPLLSDLAQLEGSLYRDIVSARLDVIKRFENLVDGDEKERVLQDHLFHNLWLLDAGWERAATSERLEQKLKTEYHEFSDGLTDEESKGRVDIRYRTNAGQHILVELKRASRLTTVPELIEQGQKYVSALRKCLTQAGYQNPNISIVFVLGRPVEEEGNVAMGRKYVDDMLKSLNGRIVYYDELIEAARNNYKEYLERSAEVDRVGLLISRL